MADHLNIESTTGHTVAAAADAEATTVVRQQQLLQYTMVDDDDGDDFISSSSSSMMTSAIINYSNLSSNQSVIVMHRTLAELIVGTFTFMVIILMTVVGNFLVILSVVTYKPLNKVQNYFLVSLAAADLCVATLVMPLHVVKFIIGEWVFGLVLCQMWLTFDILCCTASILNLCAIALDRYWAITSPIVYSSRRTLKLVLTMITVLWLLSALISIPPLIGWNDWSKENLVQTCELTQETGFVIFSAAGSFYVPLLVMTTVYIKIFATARDRLRSKRIRSMRQLSVHGNLPNDELKPILRRGGLNSTFRRKRTSSQILQRKHSCPNPLPAANDCETPQTQTEQPQPHPQDVNNCSNGTTSLKLPTAIKPLETLNVQKLIKEKERISVTKEKKAAKTLAVIMGVFVLCWLPFFLMYIIKPFCECGLHPKIEEAITWLGYINSAINPVRFSFITICIKFSLYFAIVL